MPSIVTQHSNNRRLLLGAVMIAAWWILGWLLIVRLEGDYLAIMIALAFAIGVVGAHLIRGAWACLIVPLALLSPSFAIVAFDSTGVRDWFVNVLFVLLHYNWFVGVPAALGALIGWLNLPERRGLA